MGKLLISHCVCVSCSVVSNSLRLHGLKHARLPCPSPSPRISSNSCPLCWCHPTISSSVTPCQAPLSMGIPQVRILETVAIPFSRGYYQSRDWTQVSHIVCRFFNIWASREAPLPTKKKRKKKEICHYDKYNTYEKAISRIGKPTRQKCTYVWNAIFLLLFSC